MGKKGGGARRAIAAARRAALDGASDDEVEAGSISEVEETGPTASSGALEEKPSTTPKDSGHAADGEGTSDDSAQEGDMEGATGAETRGQMLQRHKMELK